MNFVKLILRLIFFLSLEVMIHCSNKDKDNSIMLRNKQFNSKLTL